MTLLQKFTKLLVIPLPILIATMLITSCNTNKEDFILTDPPCWQGICPELTTKEAVVSKLATLEFVDSVWYDNEFHETRWNFSEGTGFIKYDQNLIVEEITIFFSSSEPTFERIKQWLGSPPEAIAYVRCNYGDMSRALDVTLFYPQTNFSITWSPRSYSNQPHSDITIDTSQKVGLITYHSQDSYKNKIDRLTKEINTSDPLPAVFLNGKTNLYSEKTCI